MKRFEIRYGNIYSNKSFRTDDKEQAERFFDKLILFAKNHNLKWTVAFWNNGWLEKSFRTNTENLINK